MGLQRVSLADSWHAGSWAVLRVKVLGFWVYLDAFNDLLSCPQTPTIEDPGCMKGTLGVVGFGTILGVKLQL